MEWILALKLWTRNFQFWLFRPSCKVSIGLHYVLRLWLTTSNIKLTNPSRSLWDWRISHDVYSSFVWKFESFSNTFSIIQSILSSIATTTTYISAKNNLNFSCCDISIIVYINLDLNFFRIYIQNFQTHPYPTRYDWKCFWKRKKKTIH